MISDKNIFTSRLKGETIDLGRSPLLKRARTRFVIKLWERDIIKFDSVYRGENGMSFLANDNFRMDRPFWFICKILELDRELDFKKGEKVLFSNLNLITMLEYRKEREV